MKYVAQEKEDKDSVEAPNGMKKNKFIEDDKIVLKERKNCIMVKKGR